MQALRIVQISVSSGGVPKRPVPASRVTTLGLRDAGHRDRAGDRHVYARELREGSIANDDPVQLLTEGEALRLIPS